MTHESVDSSQTLPSGFEELQPYLRYWGGKTTQARWDARSSASLDDIRMFYDAVLRRADDIIKHLDPLDLKSLPGHSAALLCLFLSLANCAIAIELHGAPRAPYSPFPHGIRILKGASPLG
jgi:hypothetical protein